MPTNAATDSQFDPARPLLSRRELNIEYSPLCSFFVDDFLPAHIYEQLAATYPDSSAGDYSTNTEGKFGFRSSEVADEFDEASPVETVSTWSVAAGVAEVEQTG